MPVWLWSSIPVTELFLTRLCFNVGTLRVVYLWKSRVSGQQEEKLPVYLLLSCWASVMPDVVAGRQEGPRLPWKDQQKGLAGKAGRKGVSKKEASITRGEKLWSKHGACLCRTQAHSHLQRSCKREFSCTLLCVTLHLVSTKTVCEVLLDLREMGGEGTVQRPHFQVFLIWLTQQI